LQIQIAELVKLLNGSLSCSQEPATCISCLPHWSHPWYDHYNSILQRL